MDKHQYYCDVNTQQYLDIAGVIIVVINAAQVVELINKKGCEILGYNPDEIIGKNWFDNFVPQRYRNEVKHTFNTLIAGEVIPVEKFENPVLTRDGSERIIAWQNTVITNQFGQIIKTLSSGEDISERKAMESELLNYRDQMESLVAKRTAELEASNRELEAFGYSVSHDLRAPLRVIHGYTKILSEDYAAGLDENANAVIERIRNATHRMSELIEDLLALSRVTRNKLHKRRVNISELAKEIIQDMQRGITLNIRMEVENNLYAYADYDLLRVALENLLSNACKYSGTREQSFITVGKQIKDNQEVYFVRDNGIGFDMRHANKLFQAFQRLHSADDYSGSGVGLATVARIVHRHGGNIWVESEPDKGSTFYFTLQ